MFDGITQDKLMAALAKTEATDLRAIKLLKRRKVKPGNIFPTGLKREEYADATREMLQYSQSCAFLAKRVEKLLSTPASTNDDSLMAGYNL